MPDPPFQTGPHGADPPKSSTGEGGAAGGVLDLSQLLVSSIQDYAIFVLDPGGHVLSWNPGAERMKGYTADEIVGRHFSIFYREEELAWDKPGMELEVAEEKGRFEDEGWRVRQDGSLFWANVVITTLRDDAGELVGFAKITRDLTERRAAERRAIEDARRVAEAEAESRAKSEVLATMSHELRTPLNAIGGYVDLLNMGVYGPLTEDQKEILERVQAGQRRLLRLINEVLNFTSVEAGGLTYDIGPVVLAEVLDDVEVMIGPQASDRGIEVEWHRAKEGAVALADRARVEQIVLNLVTNAVRYTERGGRVRVRPFVREGQALVEVSDTGAGIEEQHREAIFQPFTQLGRSLTSPHEGTGLGLAISRDVARAMGGDITVRSTVGEGSTFTLSLPRPGRT